VSHLIYFYAVTMLGVIMVSIILLSVAILNAIMLNVVLLCAVVLNVVMLSAAMLNVVMICALLQNVVMLSGVIECRGAEIKSPCHKNFFSSLQMVERNKLERLPMAISKSARKPSEWSNLRLLEVSNLTRKY
jgi:hypothetical protein